MLRTADPYGNEYRGRQSGGCQSGRGSPLVLPFGSAQGRL